MKDENTYLHLIHLFYSFTRILYLLIKKRIGKPVEEPHNRHKYPYSKVQICMETLKEKLPSGTLINSSCPNAKQTIGFLFS